MLRVQGNPFPPATGLHHNACGGGALKGTGVCGVEEVSLGLRAFVGLTWRDHDFLCSYSGERFDVTGAFHLLDLLCVAHVAVRFTYALRCLKGCTSQQIFSLECASHELAYIELDNSRP